ncbi:hypothetical protein T439DRAFT_323872 [Meredithblackwellia eburnea MCA 4105]
MGFIPKLTKRQYISIFKGVLAYTLAFVLIFLRKFNDLNDYPVTLTSVVLVTIAGKPGVSVGACLDGGALGILGVGAGAVGFLILAKLGHSQVAQGFVFFVMLYFLALIKAQSLRYFAFSLLAIIMAFSGIYTSILLGGVFSPKYLEAYLEAYCWGFAIVLGINILVLPISSERELRELLVSSLEHVSTFSHLIAKTYTLDITDEERAVRDGLNQSIRADIAFLGQKLSETGLEINWTKWSMADYGAATAKIRAMQQALITSYSSLVAMERYDPATLELIKVELVDSGAGKAFNRLRRGADLAFQDIVKELAVGKYEFSSPAPGSRSWNDFVDTEETRDDEDSLKGRDRAQSISYAVPLTSPDLMTSRLLEVSQKLRLEVKGQGHTPLGSRRGSFSNDDGGGNKERSDSAEGTTAVPSIAPRRPAKLDPNSLDRAGFLRDCWSDFEKEQNQAVTRLLAESMDSEDELRLHQSGPSIHDQFTKGGTQWPKVLAGPHVHEHKRPELRKRPNATVKTSSSSSDDVEKKEEDPHATAISPEDAATIANEGVRQEEKKGKGVPEARAEICSATVMRVYSFLFGMGQLCDELTALHEYLVPKDGVQTRKKTLHIHWFESIPRPKKSKVDRPQALAKALASIRGIEYKVPKVSLFVRIAHLEKLARSDTSLYAFKTACAVSVYAVFLLAPSLKSFFNTYGLTGGIITIVVAMAPTLGQTFLTFVLQIMGTGFGSIFGMVILYIFKHVGGFYFNPYGLVCFLAIYAIPMCYVIYTMPMFFAGALLAMNGTGVLVVTEWVYREVPGFIRPTFDNPALRAAKALVAMSIALGIAGIFQIFILRTPARQTLRVKLSEITFGLSSYSMLLQAYTEALCPTNLDPDRPTPDAGALAVIRSELITRETSIQMDLLALMPLLKFGAAEPAFGQPFQAGTIARLIRTHQVILDRLREARTAFGTEGFSDDIRENFTNPLAPYRRQSRRFSRALFYLCATSIATKTPLPHELPSMSTTARMIQHDAMVLSHRLTRNSAGLEILKSTSFVRYWFFLVSMGSVSYQLEAMETDLRILFGEVSEEEVLFASSK